MIFVLYGSSSFSEKPTHTQIFFLYNQAKGLRHVAYTAGLCQQVETRDRWLNAEGLTSEAEKKKRTLTNLYNARPTWLDLAHKRLDESVFAAYGWKADLSDEEILGDCWR